MADMRTAVVIPSLGGPSLPNCLEAVVSQTAPPARLVVVLSAGGELAEHSGEVEVLRVPDRLGFAAAVNRGIGAVEEDVEAVAILNDDALPNPRWLEVLSKALQEGDSAAVQGTVSDAEGIKVDGRGIEFDRWGLPNQVERGSSASDGNRVAEARFGLSATAVLFRTQVLQDIALSNGKVFDEVFDCYHEDTDLLLRMNRLNLGLSWIPGAPCRHLGSTTGTKLSWRHPWWLLSNRWRALAGNLTAFGLFRGVPRLMRGEVRAVRTLARGNALVWLVEFAVILAAPFIVVRALFRKTKGPRLTRLPGPHS
ncbi:MAG: glycosyltransferase [Thermoanaerobaculales bacterium]|nr:glycosyltransferase [Thermoanaerobaculales bacterium]